MSRGRSQHVYSWASAPAGLYLLDLVAEGRDTQVTLYATKLPGVPAVLRIRQTPRLRLQPRLHRNKVTLRWDQSVVDPQMMHYFVVVNSRQNFSSLCEAKQPVEGVNILYLSEKPSSQENKVHKKDIGVSNHFRAIGTVLDKDDVLITNVSAERSFTISSLQKGRDYYFNIFAMNKDTQLSFLYANAAFKYEMKLRPTGLKDNKPVTVNIRKMGGRALFRYKVRAGQAGAVSTLRWHVMPCGGSVVVEVRLRRQTVLPRLLVEGYKLLQVPNVLPGQRYTLIVFVPDARQMRQILGVEVLATTKPSLMPLLPTEAMVHEYSEMRTCESITVAWMPVTTQSVRYCVSASPVPVAESEAHFHPRPNQCNLDYRLRTQLDFAVKHCQDFSANDHRNVLVQTISKLRPGKEYLIQVTVKKIKGKALSYDLLRARTKSIC
ncbi:protein NDNF-like [Macrosteles quadrilineatus]|nr:protein NDNF-like [Macrosteles quadrilineatus]